MNYLDVNSQSESPVADEEREKMEGVEAVLAEELAEVE